MDPLYKMPVILSLGNERKKIYYGKQSTDLEEKVRFSPWMQNVLLLGYIEPNFGSIFLFLIIGF